MEATIPRNVNGEYTLPSGYLAVTGETVKASQHNPPLEDLAAGVTGSVARNGSGQWTGDMNAGGYRLTGLANGTQDQDAATVSQLNSSLPAGVVVDFSGSSAPSGWLLCYGQAVSRSTYARLFAAIGTVYGAGNGSTTFNVPDARGRVIAGKDDMGGTNANRLGSVWGSLSRALNGVFGTPDHTLTLAQMPSHNHGGNTGNAGAHSHTYDRTQPGAPAFMSDAGGGGAITNASASTSSAPNHQHSITSQGGGDAHNNTQPTLILNKIIKV